MGKSASPQIQSSALVKCHLIHSDTCAELKYISDFVLCSPRIKILFRDCEFTIRRVWLQLHCRQSQRCMKETWKFTIVREHSSLHRTQVGLRQPGLSVLEDSPGMFNLSTNYYWAPNWVDPEKIIPHMREKLVEV